MIVGHGIDVVKIDRITLKLNKKILTERERKIFNDLKTDKRKKEFLAGRFAAKEAFFKALGTGIKKFSFSDISILNDENGKPFIIVEKDFNILFNYAYISISHDRLAIASVILERIKGGIISKSESELCETIKKLEGGIYELDCSIPPFELQKVLKGNLIRYGNIWEASYFEYRRT